MKKSDRVPEPMFRRHKATPCADFWHTLRLGLLAAVLLFVVLPPLFRVIAH